MISFDEVRYLFEDANEQFLSAERQLILDGVSERTVCGAMMYHLYMLIRQDPVFYGYYVDVEYNRNRAAQERYKSIFIHGREKRITCDLIVHSRGCNEEQDNLLAVEMKKYENTAKYFQSRQSDRERLMAMTKNTYSDDWDGRGLPEHICRYMLGVFYEIDRTRGMINLEYYRDGSMVCNYSIPLNY